MIECLWDNEVEDICVRDDCPYCNDACPVSQFPEVCIYFTDKEEEAIYDATNYED